jgi:SNF2 family DNA or RNA helicase
VTPAPAELDISDAVPEDEQRLIDQIYQTEIRCLESQLLFCADDGELSPLSAKLKQLGVVLEEMRSRHKGKIIIFTQFTAFMPSIEDLLRRSHIRYILYRGSMNAQERKEQIELFETDVTVEVMIASIKCAAYGLNLTVASNVVIMEPCWNPMVEEQAMARVHRIGQKHAVEVVRLVVPETVENRYGVGWGAEAGLGSQ